jgi:oligopeptide transport system ATP-binding protein
MCDTIIVMYAGRVVERAPTDLLFAAPRHPYTQGLIRSVPRLDKASRDKLYSIPGTPPSLIDIPECCPFHPRCPSAMDVCRRRYPTERDLGNGHAVSCWLFEEGGSHAG